MYYLQSRYYDPEICRFINADGLASTGQGILGCNMFAYCRNNPVRYADHNGEWPQWVDDFWDEAKEFISDTRDALVEDKKRAKNNSGAYSLGIVASAGFGAGASISLGLVMDNRGNIGINPAYSAGSSLPSAFLGPFVSFTDASDIYALAGDYGSTLVIGASVGEVVGPGVDFLIINDAQKPSKQSTGRTYQFGLTAKVPTPFEFHMHLAGGGVIGFNLYDGLIDICNMILGE